MIDTGTAGVYDRDSSISVLTPAHAASVRNESTVVADVQRQSAGTGGLRTSPRQASRRSSRLSGRSAKDVNHGLFIIITQSANFPTAAPGVFGATRGMHDATGKEARRGVHRYVLARTRRLRSNCRPPSNSAAARAAAKAASARGSSAHLVRRLSPWIAPLRSSAGSRGYRGGDASRATGACKSTIRAATFAPSIVNSPSAIGNLNRRGPALPGLTKSTPWRSSIDGLCE